MKPPVIDQLRIVKSIAILQKQIVDSVHNGSKEYYKPVTIKSVNRYEDPMRIQGIKASVAWNAIKPEELPAINLNERNAISIAKVVINKATIYKIESSYPEIYQNMQSALSMSEFKDGIDAVAIPIDVYVPEWLVEFINYNEIISDNISGFPYESVGIMRMGKENMSYTNIVQL